MSDGALFKPEKDYTKEADKVLPEAEALAKVDLPVP
jgi:26S proteasome regulatory subunit N5